MLEECKLIEFPQKGDERGHLVIVEGDQDIPFDIKRVFYIYGSDKDVVRGKHANYDTEFVLINVAGTSKVRVTDGKNEKTFNLDRPHIGIYLPKLVWKDSMISRRILCCCVLPVNTIIPRNISETMRSICKS